jgi:hypothetical protein
MDFAALSASGHRPRRMFFAVTLYLLGYLSFAYAALSVPATETPNIVGLFLSAIVGGAAGIIWIWAFGVGRTDNQALLRLILVGAVIDGVFNYSAVRLAKAGGPELGEALLLGVGNLGMMAAAVGAGLWVGRGLQKPNYLVMAAIVGAVTDIFSVYAGPSKNMLSSGFFPYISFHWGLISSGVVTEIIGAGDFIFLALYFFGARKFGLDDRKTLLAMIAGVGLGFITNLVFSLPVPALPFFAVALLVVHGRELKRQMQAVPAL